MGVGDTRSCVGVFLVGNPLEMALPTPAPQGLDHTKRWPACERPSWPRLGGTFPFSAPRWGRGWGDQIASEVLTCWLRFDELNPPRGVAPARLRAHLDLSILSPGSHPAATGREQVSVGVGAEAFLWHLLSCFLSLGGLGFKSSPQALIRLQKGPAPSRVPRPPLVSFLACQLSRGTKVRPGVGPAHCLQAVPRAREETKLQAKLVETAPVFHSFTHGPLLVTQPGHAREVLCRPRLSPVTGRQGRQVKGVILF